MHYFKRYQQPVTVNLISEEYRPQRTIKFLFVSIIIASMSLLTACGGGGSGSTEISNVSNDGTDSQTLDKWLEISNTTPTKYVWDTFDNGKLFFIDRDYLFGSDVDNQVPDNYAGYAYLRTAKDDMRTTGEAHVSFSVNEPVTVFVAHRNAITNKPAWLNSWIDTGDDFISRSIYRKDFDAGSITLGGNTVDGVSGGSMYLVFMKPRIQTTGARVITQDTNGTLNTTILTNTQIADTSNQETPVAIIANPDSTSTALDTAINIPVLANDSGITSSANISIEGAPDNGSVTILANNTITYTPNTSYTGADGFSYRVSINNTMAIATVTINVNCTQCSQDITIGLSWNPSVSGSDSGYLIYYGKDTANINDLAFDLSTSTGLIQDAPYLELSAINHLQLNSGDSVCFQISAYKSSLVSDPSAPICGII